MTLELPVALLISAALLSGALVFLALKVRGMMTITVMPPIVPAPVLALPPEFEAFLRSNPAAILTNLDERVRPPSPPQIEPKVADEMIHSIVEEGRLIADQMAVVNARNGVVVSGAEKQREAMRHIKQRMEALNIPLVYRTVALRLEAAVSKSKEQ